MRPRRDDKAGFGGYREAVSEMGARSGSPACLYAGIIEAARSHDGVPAVGPDEGPGSKTRAEAAVWGHGEPRRERSAPYLTRSVGWTTQLTDPTRAQTQSNRKSTILKLGPQAAMDGALPAVDMVEGS